MGLEWPGSYCPTMPAKAHYWIEVERPGRLAVFRCEYCGRHEFLPNWWIDSLILDELFRKHGKDEGYRIFLTKYPKALALATELQDLWYSQKVVDEEQFVELVEGIADSEEYSGEYDKEHKDAALLASRRGFDLRRYD